MLSIRALVPLATSLLAQLRWQRRSLVRDKRGAAAVLFGLTMLALLIFAGMTVDVARLEFVRERLISSTDAAALAGGKVINISGTSYVTDADNFFNANFPSGYLGSTNPSQPTVSLSTDRTQLSVTETVQLPLMFAKLLGHASPQPITYTSTALAGRIEVAMVLDNSGSMAQPPVSGGSQSKMAIVQNAANTFAASLTSLQNGNVRIAVVPFTATVNTGMNQLSPPTWIDPLASYIYAQDPATGALPTNALTANPATTTFSDVFTSAIGTNVELNRFTLFSLFNAASSSNHLWDGCVEMRPPLYSIGGTERYAVLDTAPKASLPGSLFVPLFAPAEAKTPTTVLASPDPSARLLYYNHYLNDIYSDDATASSTLIAAQNAQNVANTFPSAGANAAAATTYATALAASRIAQGDYLKYGTILSAPSYVSGASFLSVQKTQSSLDSTLSAYGIQWFYPYGPNAGCEGYAFTSSGAPGSTLVTLPPVSHLSASTSTVSATINAMVPMGETYLPIGLFWGWEMISPNSVFADSQAGYNDPGITKAIILLTDGCDEVINGFDVYDLNDENACGNNMRTGAFGYTFPNTSDFISVGYAWQNRIGPISANPNPVSDPNLLVMSDRQAVADAEMTTLCSNIRAAGIQIYVIGIDKQGSTNQALISCAGTNQPPFYNSTPDPNDLTPVFQGIAASLTKVRLIAPTGSDPGI